MQEEITDGSLYDRGRLLICRYLPLEMRPPDISSATMSEFYHLVAMARVARKMEQEDRETTIIQAICKVLEMLNE